MNAVRSQEQRDADLEVQIDQIFYRMEGASEADSQELTTQFAVLVRRRSPHMQLLIEMRWRARGKNAA